jgi:protein SCO1
MISKWILSILMCLPLYAAEEVGITERLGTKIPLGLAFRNENSEPVKLSGYFHSKPVVLVLAYSRCPMLCSFVLRGVEKAISHLGWKPHSDFEVVTISFDPTEKPGQFPKNRWPRLTGSEDSIRTLTQSLGFQAAYDSTTKEFAHPAAIFILTSEGVISRYLYGIEFPVKDLKLALLEASNGKIGSTLDRILLRCFRFDPAKRKYSLFIDRFTRAGAAGILILLASGLAFCWRKEKRQTP